MTKLIRRKAVTGRAVIDACFVLGLSAVIVAFIIGCVVAGYVTTVWPVRMDPEVGQNGLAVMVNGLVGGAVCAGATIFFVLHRVAKKGPRGF